MMIHEPYFAYENLGHSGLDDIFRQMQLCAPFHRIITSRPPKFLPQQVMAFYIFWNEPMDDEYESITVLHSEDTANDTEINLLKAVKMTFELEDSGELSLSFNTDLLVDTYQIMTLPALEEKDLKNGLKGFQRTSPKLEFCILFDVVHKVFLSQAGTNDMVTH